MDKTYSVKGVEDFKVVFIGAGNVMFGSNEGPWNHSLRLEQKLGARLKVLAVIDPDVERAAVAVQKKLSSVAKHSYQDTHVLKSLEDFVSGVSRSGSPRAFVLGTPAFYRGTIQQGRDIEMQLLESFPKAAIFVEKPIATGPKSEIREAFEVAERVENASIICSVGYMFRYLKAVQTMKRIIEDNHLTIMCVIARYACAYESIAKLDWWDKSKSAGPIVEQATHLCDLCRYFGGEIDISTIKAHALEWHESAGHLSNMSVDESQIAPGDRIPRVTAATWKYQNGAVGSLTHVVALQGTAYSSELEIYADGYWLKVANLYVQPVLFVRQPGDDSEKITRFEEDDPFYSEISSWADTIENGQQGLPILSSYKDACRTYEFTWAIREASERNVSTTETAIQIA